MNRSQEKQTFLVGKMLRRDTKRVNTLHSKGKLKLHFEVLNFLSSMFTTLSDKTTQVTRDDICNHFDATFKNPSETQQRIKNLLIS